MTLALILFLGGVASSPAVRNLAPETAIQTQTQSAPDQPATQESQSPGNSSAGSSAQGTTGKTTSSSAQQSSSTQTQTVKKASKRKKNSSADCKTTSAQSSASKGASSNQTADGSKKSAASSCPPSKVIVRQGSTSDSSIQLVGGAAGPQASDERNNSIQMLETTEANLKKMNGTQLDSNQQDMVKQVRQFMDQSKAANSAGDLDQARTLAWKAQLLSEELLKTQK